MNKKTLLFLISIFCFTFCWTESFKIKNVNYEISGLTRKYVLERKIPIDTKRVFHSEDELNQYLLGLEGKYSNLRVFDTVKVSITSIEQQDDNFNVDVLVSLKDSWNIIAVPYPSFDSNTGLKLKLKVKDYNFLGSLEEFDFSIDYEYALDSSTNTLNWNFTLPFPSFIFLTLDTTFLLDFDFNYDIGNNAPEYKTGQTLLFSKKINSIFGVDFSIKNDIYVLPNIRDLVTFEDTLSLAFPISLSADKSLNLVWTPNINFNFIWDFDSPNKDISTNIDSDKIRSSAFIFGNEISVSKIDWINNFRNGYSVSINQLIKYNLHSNDFTETISFHSKEFKSFSQFLALYAQQQFFINIDGSTVVKGNFLRGIKNDLFKTNSALILNFDLPIKVLQTDWVSFFDFFGLNWNWTRALDFELQICPFFDMALGYNDYTKTSYLIPDGFYANGFELLVYPNKMKSIVGRVSFGVDTVKVLEKIGQKIQIVDKLTNRVFNTDWRTGSAWELYIGIGLYY